MQTDVHGISSSSVWWILGLRIACDAGTSPVDPVERRSGCLMFYSPFGSSLHIVGGLDDGRLWTLHIAQYHFFCLFKMHPIDDSPVVPPRVYRSARASVDMCILIISSMATGLDIVFSLANPQGLG